MPDDLSRYQGGLGNVPNPDNTDRAILERIEHKLDVIFAMLQPRRVTEPLPEDQKSL